MEIGLDSIIKRNRFETDVNCWILHIITLKLLQAVAEL